MGSDHVREPPTDRYLTGSTSHVFGFLIRLMWDCKALSLVHVTAADRGVAPSSLRSTPLLCHHHGLSRLYAALVVGLAISLDGTWPPVNGGRWK